MNYNFIPIDKAPTGFKYRKEFEAAYLNSHYAGIPDLGRKNWLCGMKIDPDIYKTMYSADMSEENYLKSIMKYMTDKVHGRKFRPIYGNCVYFKHRLVKSNSKEWFELLFYTNKEDVEVFLDIYKELGKTKDDDAQQKELDKAKEEMDKAQPDADPENIIKSILSGDNIPQKRKRGRPPKSASFSLKSFKDASVSPMEQVKKNMSKTNTNGPKKRGRPKKVR